MKMFVPDTSKGSHPCDVQRRENERVRESEKRESETGWEGVRDKVSKKEWESETR